MKKSILLAFVAVIGVNCGNSADAGKASRQDLKEIIESMKKLDPCTGETYQAMGQTQIDAIEKICTTAELGGLNTYYACLASAACNTDLSAAVVTCASKKPTISAQCYKVSPIHISSDQTGTF
ncbi:MAG: hypothetical protein WCK42_01890 [Myxococcaceae bacterium]